MIVYFAIILTTLLGFCGLAIDVGRVELRTNQLQAAADAGALAAAGEVLHAGMNSNWQTAANNDISVVEAADGIPSTGVTAPHLGATFGPYVGDFSTVQITLTQDVPTIFLGLLTAQNSAMTVSVKAVAQVPPCMIFFGSPTIYNTYDYWVASAGVDTPPWACPLYSQNGFIIDYFARYGGSQVRSSAPAASSIPSGTTSNAPVYSVPPIKDPLAYITTPTAGNCINANPISMLNQPTTAIIALVPGTYCGKTNGTAVYTPGPGPACGQTPAFITPAVDVEGKWGSCPTQGGLNGNNCTTRPTVTLAPGLYIFTGGVNFTCATVNGTGVTMYFTKNARANYGILHAISTAWNVSAPNDASGGGIAGIALMNDPNWTGGPQDFHIVYSTWYGDGVVYLRKTGLDGYSLNMSGPNYLNVVAASMYTYDAQVRPSVNYANLPAGSPLHTTVTLVQ